MEGAGNQSMNLYKKYLAKSFFVRLILIIFIIFIIYLLFSFVLLKKTLYKDLRVNTLESIKDNFRLRADSILAYFNILRDEGYMLAKDERIKHYFIQYERGKIGVYTLRNFLTPKIEEYVKFSRFTVGVIGYLKNGREFIRSGNTLDVPAESLYVEKNKTVKYSGIIEYENKPYYEIIYPVMVNSRIVAYYRVIFQIDSLKDIVDKEYYLGNIHSSYSLYFNKGGKYYDYHNLSILKVYTLRRLMQSYQALKCDRIKTISYGSRLYYIKNLIPYNIFLVLTLEDLKLNRAINLFVNKTIYYSIFVFIIVIASLYLLARPLFSRYLVSLDFLNREIENKNKEIEAEKKTFERYLDTAPVIYIFMDKYGKIRYMNQTGLDILEMTLDEVSGKECRDIVGCGKYSERFYQLLDAKLDAEKRSGERIICEVTSKSGRLYTIEWEGRRIKDETGIIDGIILAGRDITRETQREAQLNLILESINAFIWNALVVDRDMKLTYVSNSILKIIGSDEVSLNGDTLFGFVVDEDRDKLRDIKTGVLERGGGSVDFKFRDVNGNLKWIKLWYNSRDVGGRIYVDGFGIEATHEKELENWIKSILESISVLDIGYLIYRVDSVDNAVIVDVNDAFERITGYSREDVVGKMSPLELVYVEDREKVKENLRRRLKGEPVPPNYILSISRKDGSTIKVEINVTMMNIEKEKYIFVLFNDVTEKLIQQRNMLQQQKMESLGVLASGIAHDFNNILTGILGWTSLLKTMIKNEEHLKMLDEIEKASNRASGLVRNLLGFARMGKYEIKPLNLNNEVLNVLELLKPTIKKNINIVTELEPDLHSIDGDPDQIQQVIMNLAVNAIQAMPEGGTLTISTYNFVVTEEFARSHYNIESGDYVVLVVNDTGVGMDKKTLEKIFDPFFTTKKKGEGTGLGLSTVYGIVKNHKGAITVYSEVGKGTSFKVYLPVSKKERKNTGINKSKSIISGKGNILLVDDEKSIIDVYTQFLSDIGYNVVPAMDGMEAIEKFKKFKDSIDVVILDLNLPGVSGESVYDEIKKIKPEVKVIVTTGFSFNGEVQKLLDRGVESYLKKPFDMKELSHVLFSVLNRY